MTMLVQHEDMSDFLDVINLFLGVGDFVKGDYLRVYHYVSRVVNDCSLYRRTRIGMIYRFQSPDLSELHSVFLLTGDTLLRGADKVNADKPALHSAELLALKSLEPLRLIWKYSPVVLTRGTVVVPPHDIVYATWASNCLKPFVLREGKTEGGLLFGGDDYDD